MRLLLGVLTKRSLAIAEKQELNQLHLTKTHVVGCGFEQFRKLGLEAKTNRLNFCFHILQHTTDAADERKWKKVLQRSARALRSDSFMDTKTKTKKKPIKPKSYRIPEIQVAELARACKASGWTNTLGVIAALHAFTRLSKSKRLELVEAYKNSKN